MQAKTQRAYSDETYRDLLGLPEMSDIKHAEHLLQALAQLDPSLLLPAQSHSFLSLIVLGSSGLEELLKRTESGTKERRLEAIDAMSHIFLNGGRSGQVLDSLKAIMRAESDLELVATLAKCIAVGGDKTFLLEQMKRLADEDPGLVASAAKLLGYGRYTPALPLLIALVSPERFVESSSVIWALGEMESMEALPVLEFSLVKGFRTVECMLAMGKIGQLASIPKLTPMMYLGLPQQRDAAYRALAMILHRNRDTPALLTLIAEELVSMIVRQLDELGASLQTSTRFHMLLCLARLEHKLDMARVRRYLGIELDDRDAGNIASFFIHRGGHKGLGVRNANHINQGSQLSESASRN